MYCATGKPFRPSIRAFERWPQQRLFVYAANSGQSAVTTSTSMTQQPRNLELANKTVGNATLDSSLQEERETVLLDSAPLPLSVLCTVTCRHLPRSVGCRSYPLGLSAHALAHHPYSTICFCFEFGKFLCCGWCISATFGFAVG
jgi:hypothetical protein